MVSGNGQDRKIEISVPLRLDIGGTWDLKALALTYEYLHPMTVNIALELRTVIEITPYSPGLILIEDQYKKIETTQNNIDFGFNFGMLLAICNYYQIDGISIKLKYTIPPGNGLGGSGAVMTAVIAGINAYLSKQITAEEVVFLAHEIEDGMKYSHTGLQDQCAAVYGGVNLWKWQYSKNPKYSRQQLLYEYADFSERLIVAYLGIGHGLDVNKKQIDSFYSHKTRPKWLEINRITEVAAGCIRRKYWNLLSACINREHNLRIELVPERIIPIAEELREVVLKYGDAFGIAGAGAGGSVFAFAQNPSHIPLIAEGWSSILAFNNESIIIENPEIAKEGLIVNG